MTLSPVELRPRRIWFLVAALLAVAGVLAAAGVMLFVLPGGGDLGQPLTQGQPVIVQLSPSDEKMVWVKEAGQNVPDIDISCTASPLDGQEIRELSQDRLRSERVQLDVDHQRWRGLLTLSAEPAGRYTVTCVTSGADRIPALSIGDPPRLHGPRDRALGRLGSLGLAGISVIVGAVLAVVVAVRRGSHRVRLSEQRTRAGHG